MADKKIYMTKAEEWAFRREAMRDKELGLDTPLSDGHFEALGLEPPEEKPEVKMPEEKPATMRVDGINMDVEIEDDELPNEWVHDESEPPSFVHPDPENHMLNTVLEEDDGYSFDEKDDEEDEDDDDFDSSSAYSRFGDKYPDYEAEMLDQPCYDMDPDFRF